MVSRMCWSAKQVKVYVSLRNATWDVGRVKVMKRRKRSARLYTELQLSSGHPLRLQLGGLKHGI